MQITGGNWKTYVYPIVILALIIYIFAPVVGSWLKPEPVDNSALTKEIAQLKAKTKAYVDSVQIKYDSLAIVNANLLYQVNERKAKIKYRNQYYYINDNRELQRLLTGYLDSAANGQVNY